VPPQPGAGDHRRSQRRADRGHQGIQPAHQQALALNLGMPEPGALLLVPVDALLLGVDIDKGQHVLAGQQRGPAGQLAQQQPVHLAQLEHVPPGERPQERPQRGRCPDPAKQAWHGAVPQQAQVIDAVRAADHPRHDGRHLHLRVHPAPVADPDVLIHQAAQARPLGQRHHRHQTRPRHRVWVIKRRVNLRQVMQQSHLRGVLSAWGPEVSATPIVPVQRAPFASTRPNQPLFTRWIEDKLCVASPGQINGQCARRSSFWRS
jgi:hypothetical protein